MHAQACAWTPKLMKSAEVAGKPTMLSLGFLRFGRQMLFALAG
jgi:hypothetical protein